MGERRTHKVAKDKLQGVAEEASAAIRKARVSQSCPKVMGGVGWPASIPELEPEAAGMGGAQGLAVRRLLSHRDWQRAKGSPTGFQGGRGPPNSWPKDHRGLGHVMKG